IQVAYQIGGGTRRESRVNVETVARIMIVKLGYAHLRVCRRNHAQNSKAQSSTDERINANWRFHRRQADNGELAFTIIRCLRVKTYDDRTKGRKRCREFCVFSPFGARRGPGSATPATTILSTAGFGRSREIAT